MKKSGRIISVVAALILTLSMAFALAACKVDNYLNNGSDTDSTSGSVENTSGNNGGNSQGGASQNGAGTQSNSQGGNASASQGGGTGETPTVVDNGNLVSYAAVSESLYCVWKETSVGSAKAYYKKSGTSSYTQVDKELIRQNESGKARVDMLGLAAGSYDVKIDVGSSDKDIVIENIAVTAYASERTRTTAP